VDLFGQVPGGRVVDSSNGGGTQTLYAHRFGHPCLQARLNHGAAARSVNIESPTPTLIKLPLSNLIDGGAPGAAVRVARWCVVWGHDDASFGVRGGAGSEVRGGTGSVFSGLPLGGWWDGNGDKP
jgi:hypothetical protein